MHMGRAGSLVYYTQAIIHIVISVCIIRCIDFYKNIHKKWLHVGAAV